ncbi:hypothetical protein GCM10028798_26180 [Humibacter antri]
MLRRLMPVLLIALVAVAGLDAAQTASGGVLVAVGTMAVLMLAAIGVLARGASGQRPIRLAAARAAWLGATAAATPTHTDARALMRARPPSATS